MEEFLFSLLAPMGWFVAYPALALLPTLAFAGAYPVLRRRGTVPPRTTLVVALVWAAYAVYEWRMSVWAETVTAPIRLDLLLVGPLLYAASAVGVFSWWRAARRRT